MVDEYTQRLLDLYSQEYGFMDPKGYFTVAKLIDSHRELNKKLGQSVSLEYLRTLTVRELVGLLLNPPQPEPVKAMSEDVLRICAGTPPGGWPMSPAEREGCLQEIAKVEGYERKHYETATDQMLARGVLSAWTDAARDKGLL